MLFSNNKIDPKNINAYSDLPFSLFSPFTPWFPVMPCRTRLSGKLMMPCPPRLPQEPLFPFLPGGPWTHTFSNGWHIEAGLSLLNCLVISLRTSSMLRDLLLIDIRLRRTLVFVVFSESRKTNKQQKINLKFNCSFTLGCVQTSAIS